MRRVALILALSALVGVTALVADADSTEPSMPSECVVGELLVKFRPGADPAAVTSRHGGTIASVIEGIEVYVVSVAAGTVEQKVTEFGADPEVEFAEPNGIVRAAEPTAEPESCEEPLERIG